MANNLLPLPLPSADRFGLSQVPQANLTPPPLPLPPAGRFNTPLIQPQGPVVPGLAAGAVPQPQAPQPGRPEIGVLGNLFDLPLLNRTPGVVQDILRNPLIEATLLSLAGAGPQGFEALQARNQLLAERERTASQERIREQEEAGRERRAKATAQATLTAEQRKAEREAITRATDLIREGASPAAVLQEIEAVSPGSGSRAVGAVATAAVDAQNEEIKQFWYLDENGLLAIRMDQMAGLKPEDTEGMIGPIQEDQLDAVRSRLSEERSTERAALGDLVEDLASGQEDPSKPKFEAEDIRAYARAHRLTPAQAKRRLNALANTEKVRREEEEASVKSLERIQAESFARGLGSGLAGAQLPPSVRSLEEERVSLEQELNLAQAAANDFFVAGDLSKSAQARARIPALQQRLAEINQALGRVSSVAPEDAEDADLGTASDQDIADFTRKLGRTPPSGTIFTNQQGQRVRVP